jgi:hypothetical protein
VADGAAGLLGGHPPHLHLVLGRPAEGEGGGQQPSGRQGGVEVAGFLTSPDDLDDPVKDRAVPRGVLLGADRGQVPQERVPLGGLPSRVEQPHQRRRGRRLLLSGRVDGGGNDSGPVVSFMSRLPHPGPLTRRSFSRTHSSRQGPPPAAAAVGLGVRSGSCASRSFVTLTTAGMATTAVPATSNAGNSLGRTYLDPVGTSARSGGSAREGQWAGQRLARRRRHAR